MFRWVMGVLAGWGLALPAGASQCSFDQAIAQFEGLLQSQALPGGGILIADRGGTYLERYFGSYQASTVVSIASATKLLSATRMLQLQSRRIMDLDAPVSTVLPQFTGEKGTMTVRQMFSHTAGYGDDSGIPILFNSNITLAQAVDQIACCRPLNAGYTVGGQFSYGGVSMHIAGRVAEVLDGSDWQLGWQRDLSVPLGITTIDWQTSSTQNYGIAGGARSSMPDYGRLLRMLAKGGQVDGKRIIGRTSIDQLKVNQVGSLPIASAPPNVMKPVRYGLGSWHDGMSPAGQAPLIHSLGAFGFFPWLDTGSARYGVFMIRGGANINAAAVPVYFSMLTSIKNVLDSGCEPVQLDDDLLGEGFES